MPPPAPPPAGDAFVGRTVAGKFRILELLGEGGMGKVYKARHLSLDKLVCVKTLRRALQDDATIVGRFEREAKAASRLNHANAIQVLDFGQDDDGALYIAMEYVSGQDLRKTLRDEFPLGEERICHIVAQVLGALSEAHAQNVVHRDLKPENVMLEQRRGEPDFVKVLDFGIAKIQEPDVPGLTSADVVCGTPLYMSPEQATGSAFDARADLYAVGVILYQLTTGQLPFDGANSMEILLKHVNDLPTPPRTRRPEVAISPEMEALILRALEKNPAKRPQSAEAMRTDLLRLRDLLRHRREEAESVAQAAASAHREERAREVQERQAAQRASFGEKTGATSGTKLSRSRKPLLAAASLIFLLGVVAMSRLFASAGEDAPEKFEPALAETATEMQQDVPNDVVADPTQTQAAEAAVTPVVTVPPRSARGGAAQPPAPRAPSVANAGDARRAREIVEQADLLFEEESFASALEQYRQAALVDGSYAPAFRGIFRAGFAKGDLKAARVGGAMYVRLAPDAPDARRIQEQLDRL